MASLSAETSLLSAAADALKRSGTSVPISKQIDSVSNALTGTYRKRELTQQEKGYPAEAKNVLEMLKIQIYKALNNLSNGEQSEKAYNKIIDDLEIIEAFASRIRKFYYPQGEAFSPLDDELTQSVASTIEKAKSEAITSLALQKINQKINAIEQTYRDNPSMTSGEFRTKLEDLALKVKKWEDEFIPDNPILKDSPGIIEKIYKLKRQLNEAWEISNLEAHPGVIGKMGLDLLRITVEMLQQAKSQFEIEQALIMAVEANKNLKKSGRIFQERGRAFNLQIEQTVATFVDKQIRRLEAELSNPIYYVPEDNEKNERIADRLISQKEQLITYFQFVIRWGGSHIEDLMERIALVFEKIGARSEKFKYLILDEAGKNGIPEDRVLKLAQIGSKFRRAEKEGQDFINPNIIFHETNELSDAIIKLLEQFPDPSHVHHQNVHIGELGKFYFNGLSLRGRAELELKDKKLIQSLLERIDYFAAHQDFNIDIFNERRIQKEYLNSLITQERRRFLALLGVDPSMTTGSRYLNYPDPSLFPFKGSQLVKVMNNYRIIENFLQGKYGFVQEHPAVKRVAGSFYGEFEEYCEKILIILLKKLKLRVLNPPKLEEIESIIVGSINKLPEEIKPFIHNPESRVETIIKEMDLPQAIRKEAVELQELWLMYDFLRLPHIMREKNTFPEELIQECQEHKSLAERILLPMASRNAKSFQKLIEDSIDEVDREAEKIVFEISPQEIIGFNEENQFYKDHQITEKIPLYVLGVAKTREKEQDVRERLLALVDNDLEFANRIESLATKSLFYPSMQKFRSLLSGLSQFPGTNSIEVRQEEGSQYLFFDEEKKKCRIEGYGLLSVIVEDRASGIASEVGSIVMKVETEVSKDSLSRVKGSFIDKSYNDLVAGLREKKKWKLL